MDTSIMAQIKKKTSYRCSMTKLCWKCLQIGKPITLSKRDSGTGVFLCLYAKYFRTCFLQYTWARCFLVYIRTTERTMKTLEKLVKSLKQWHQNHTIGTVPVSFLLTFNIIQTFFWCFYCWLWACIWLHGILFIMW